MKWTRWVMTWPLLLACSVGLAQDAPPADAPADPPPPPGEAPPPKPSDGPIEIAPSEDDGKEKLDLPTPAPNDPAFTVKEGVTSKKGLKLHSRSFTHKGELPPQFTCDGDGISPELGWENIPKKASFLVLTMTDVTAGDGVQWLVYNIPDKTVGLAPGIPADHMPLNTLLGKNAKGVAAYNPPCPDQGEAHRYQLTLTALDTELMLGREGAEAPTWKQVQAGMQGHVVDQIAVTVSYKRMDEAAREKAQEAKDAPPPPEGREDAPAATPKK